MKIIQRIISLMAFALLPSLAFGWGEIIKKQLLSNTSRYSSDIVGYAGVTDNVTVVFNAKAQTVNTLADLVALQAGSASSVVYVAGRLASNDGYAGFFAWDDSNQTAAVAVDPHKGLYVAPSFDPTGASGIWVRQDAEKVFARWFGAVGDGIQDDTQYIQAAIDSGAAVIFGGNYTYKVSQVNINRQCRIIDFVFSGGNAGVNTIGCLNITANNVVIDNCRVTQKSRRFGASTNYVAIYANGANELIIRDCVVVGSESNSIDDFGAIHIKNSTRCMIVNNKVSQSRFEGISLVNCTDCVVTGNYCLDINNSGVATVNGTRITVSNNTVDYVDTSSYLGASGLSINSTHTMVSNNTINNSYLHGIVLGHTLGARTNLCADYSVVSGNTIRNHGRRLGTNGGITIDNALFSIVSGNTIEASVNNIGSGQYNSGILFTDTTTNSAICDVSNNAIDTIYGSGITATNLPDASAAVPSSVIISNNTIKNVSIVGINISKGHILKVLGNNIFNANRANNAAGNGITYTYSATDPTELLINGNSIKDSTPYQRYGISLSSVPIATVVKMSNNTIRGWVTKPYNDTTPGTVESRGNDYDGTPRQGIVLMTTGTTSTTIYTGQVYAKEKLVVSSGNATAVNGAMVFSVGTVKTGAFFVVNHTAAPAGAAISWSVL